MQNQLTLWSDRQTDRQTDRQFVSCKDIVWCDLHFLSSAGDAESIETMVNLAGRQAGSHLGRQAGMQAMSCRGKMYDLGFLGLCQ